MDILTELKNSFPKNLTENPFDYLILKCLHFFRPKFCSFLAPNMRTGYWDIKTRHTSKIYKEAIVKVENKYEVLTQIYNKQAIWSKIEAGICNVALCKRHRVYIDDVDATSYQYIKQFEGIRCEIVIPLICDIPITWKDNALDNIIGCIVLDYEDKDDYDYAKSILNENNNFESFLGDFLYCNIFIKSRTSWDSAITNVTYLSEINFDTNDSIECLNMHLSNIWPSLEYYSVWVADQTYTMDDVEKAFVRIGAIFLKEEMRLEYLQIDEKMEYVLKQSDDHTYAEFLNEYTHHFKEQNFIYPRHVYKFQNYKPMSDSFRKLLYRSYTDLDFHFVPLVENNQNAVSSQVIRGIIVFVFQFPGDSRLIEENKVSILSRYIFDRVSINMYRKTQRLRVAIENNSAKMYSDFKFFIENIQSYLLEVIPADIANLWLMKKGEERSYFRAKEAKNEYWIDDVDQIQKDYVLNQCLSDKKVREAHKHHTDYMRRCEGCPVKKEYEDNNILTWQSCMVAKITGLKGTPRAIIFLINRRNPSLKNRIQAFSFIDHDTIQDIAGLLGAFFSLHEISGTERTLRTILPHELAAPITSLSHKLKDIETLTAKLIGSSLNNNIVDEKVTQLEKKFLDAWISCDAAAQNSENFIKYIKKIEKVRPDNFRLYDLIEQIKHLFTSRFNKKKQIYVLCENFDSSQFIKCNRSMLFSTLHNIFDNALKYSHRYTIFHVRQLKIREDTLTISFINYGIGIDQDELEKVFDLNYQSRNTFRLSETESERSHGIGLALSKWYIKKCHKGNITFKSIKKSNFNPFFLYIIKKLIPNGNPIFKDVYEQNELMKNAVLDNDVVDYFKSIEILNFFNNFKPLGPLGEFFFQYVLETETFQNELILSIPKKYKG